jgi:hypothetical protein
VLDELFGVPPVLGRDLGSSSPAAHAAFDDQPVTADLDLGDRVDGASRW